MAEADSNHAEELQDLLQSMTSSISASRASLKPFLEDPQSLDFADGISLLSLKHNVMISYLRSLALLSARRALGHSLQDRSQPTLPFSDIGRDKRGDGAGDMVDSMIEGRVVLEKVDALESRMRYQIEKLLKTAEQADGDAVTNDPLAFKPNPQNLVGDDNTDESEDDREEAKNANGDAIYRPPHLAPVPYVEKSNNKSRRDRPPVPSALALLQEDPSRPHVETTSGLGGMPSLHSGRAKYLKRVTEYEEENFTRLMMKKSDAKRRARDEADIALGADLANPNPNRGRQRAGGLEDEFGDILRSVHRSSNQLGQGDGYDELRKKGKKQNILLRSRDQDVGRKRDATPEFDGEGDGRRMRKRTRFDMEAKSANKKLKRKK